MQQELHSWWQSLSELHHCSFFYIFYKTFVLICTDTQIAGKLIWVCTHLQFTKNKGATSDLKEVMKLTVSANRDRARYKG